MEQLRALLHQRLSLRNDLYGVEWGVKLYSVTLHQRELTKQWFTPVWLHTIPGHTLIISSSWNENP